MIITKNQLAESMGNFHLLSPISILDQCNSMQCIPMAKIYLKCDSLIVYLCFHPNLTCDH